VAVTMMMAAMVVVMAFPKVVLGPMPFLAKGMTLMPGLGIQAIIAEPTDIIIFESMPYAPLPPASAKTMTAAMMAAMAVSLPMATTMMTAMPLMMMPCLMGDTGA